MLPWNSVWVYSSVPTCSNTTGDTEDVAACYQSSRPLMQGIMAGDGWCGWQSCCCSVSFFPPAAVSPCCHLVPPSTQPEGLGHPGTLSGIHRFIATLVLPSARDKLLPLLVLLLFPSSWHTARAAISFLGF